MDFMIFISFVVVVAVAAAASTVAQMGRVNTGKPVASLNNAAAQARHGLV